jgi:hypothetical protein
VKEKAMKQNVQSDSKNSMVKRRIAISLLAVLLIGLLTGAAICGVGTARYVLIQYDLHKTYEQIEEQVDGYVRVPFSASTQTQFNEINQNIDEYYKRALNLYKQTVESYNGILIDAYNFETGGTAPTFYEEFGQDWIIINTNYLEFNPIYAPNGNPITKESLDNRENIFNVIVPISKEDKVSDIVDFRVSSYGKDGLDLGLTKDSVNVVFYDDSISQVQAFNNMIIENEGIIESPVLEIWNEKYFGMQTGNAFARGFFLKEEANDSELRSLIEQCGLSDIITNTPTVAETFTRRLSDNKAYILVTGSISLGLLVGAVVVLIILYRVAKGEKKTDD